jgi:hypothetical protein
MERRPAVLFTKSVLPSSAVLPVWHHTLTSIGRRSRGRARVHDLDHRETHFEFAGPPT